MVLTMTAIKGVAANLLRDFHGALAEGAAHIRPINIEALATRYLGLRVAYTRPIRQRRDFRPDGL
jgi:hypothetical protein